MVEVEVVLAARNELGEGPRWHNGEQAIYWVDIEAGCIHRLQPLGAAHQTAAAGEKVGALAFRRGGGLLLAGERGFAFFDPSSSVLNRIADPERDKPGTRFNDGAVDRAGRFWAGTLGDDYQNSLYRLDPDGSVRRMDTGFDISNGIGWSPDNRVMYFVDSTPGVLYAYDFDLTGGEIANRRVLVNRSQRPGVPDGLTVDAAGFIWIAVWGGGCLERYDPRGRLERVIPLPVRYPTSVTFGGADLDELYITSARYEIPRAQRAKHPLAGNLFRIRGIGKGIAEPMFAG
ncbi:MAG: SMP-30/gluconolactonase/LRE family protein [Chloroflexota bacterium]|jgi:sugar lactone lactonase YvrE